MRPARMEMIENETAKFEKPTASSQLLGVAQLGQVPGIVVELLISRHCGVSFPESNTPVCIRQQSLWWQPNCQWSDPRPLRRFG